MIKKEKYLQFHNYWGVCTDFADIEILDDILILAGVASFVLWGNLLVSAVLVVLGILIMYSKGEFSQTPNPAGKYRSRRDDSGVDEEFEEGPDGEDSDDSGSEDDDGVDDGDD